MTFPELDAQLVLMLHHAIDRFGGRTTDMDLDELATAIEQLFYCNRDAFTKEN